MKGLIIKPYWADLILAGDKTWEIRGSWTSIRGKIQIIKSGSGMIYGEAELYDCITVRLATLIGNKDKHLVEPEKAMAMYKRPHAWVLRNAKKYDEPIPYSHPQGAVIWVNLGETA